MTIKFNKTNFGVSASARAVERGQIGSRSEYLDDVAAIAEYCVKKALMVSEQDAHQDRNKDNDDYRDGVITDYLNEPSIDDGAARVITALSPHAFEERIVKQVLDDVGDDADAIRYQIPYQTFYVDLWEAAGRVFDRLGVDFNARSKKNPNQWGKIEISKVDWWKVDTNEGVLHVHAGSFDGRPTKAELYDDLTTVHPNTVSAMASKDVKIKSYRKVPGWDVYVENATPPTYGPFRSRKAAEEFVEENF